MSRPTKMIMTILLFTTLTTWAQTDRQINQADSLFIKTEIEGFYSWYADQIKNHLDDYRPAFEKRNDGMTTLDFKKYRDGLKKHGFTENFIERKVESYKTCVDNLSKVKYEDFLKFDGLDQYEEIKCDFDNVREWTMDQERHDGADLIRFKVINKRTINGIIHFFNLNIRGEKYIWEHKQAIVTFLRQGRDWKIDNIEIERFQN